MSENTPDLAAFIQRKTISDEPHIYFTLDFRQVVEGHLHPGMRCHLRYDPTRLPVEPGYAFGRADEPVVAHVQFRDGGEVHDFPLHSIAGIMVERDIDITGHGSTLDASFPLPKDAEKLVVWFSHRRTDGTTNWDSRKGQNFVFRFIINEIWLLSATIKPAPNGATNVLSVSVAASASIDRVWLIYHLADSGVAGPEKQAPLERRDKTEDGKQIWRADLDVAFNHVVILDLAYEADGNTAIDDNNQRHYVVFPSSIMASGTFT